MNSSHLIKIEKYFLQNDEYKKIKKAVIPVAGFGARFLPATKAMPKELLPIVDKPLIEDHFDANNELETILRATGKDVQAEIGRNLGAFMGNLTKA